MKRERDDNGVTLAAKLVDDLTGRFTKEHLVSADGEELVSFTHVVSKSVGAEGGDYEGEYIRFGANFDMVEAEAPPPGFKVVEWGSYLTWADLREHQFSILDYGARAHGREFRDINPYDGELLNKF